MRVHMGCGTVYLEGWLNVDMWSPKTHIARNRPDLVKKYITTEDKYYARHEDKTIDTLRDAPLDQEYVCDVYGSWIEPPWEKVTVTYHLLVNELLARHSFEHLSITEASTALRLLQNHMLPGAILRLDVPDHEATLEKLMETRDRFYIRHLLGPRRNDYGYHMMSYTPDRLRKLVEQYGFVFESEESNIHFYPAFCLRFRRK